MNKHELLLIMCQYWSTNCVNKCSILMYFNNKRNFVCVCVCVTGVCGVYMEILYYLLNFYVKQKLF